MGADFPLDLLVGLLADGSDLVVAVVVVDDVLHLQLDGGRVCGKGRNANLNKIMEDVSSLTQSLASIFALLNSVKRLLHVLLLKSLKEHLRLLWYQRIPNFLPAGSLL